MNKIIIAISLSLALFAQPIEPASISTPSGFDNQSEEYIKSMRWFPLIKDMNVSVNGKNLTFDEEVPSGEVATYHFTVKNRETARNLTIAWGDNAEMGNVSLAMSPGQEINSVGSYGLTAGKHEFWVRVTYDRGSWMDDDATITGLYDESRTFSVVEPAKIVTGFEMFFAIAATAVAVMARRHSR